MRRRMLLSQARLPAEYQEVEWIGNTSKNNGFINTQFIIPSEDAKIEIKFNTDYGSMFGSTTYDNKCWFCNYSNGLYVGNVNIASSIPYNTDVVVTLKAKNGLAYSSYNGHQYQREYDTTIISSQPILLFRYQLSNGYGKIFYTKIWSEDILVREMIACYRKADSKIGMYDLVNNYFYQGIGDFTKGADVLGGY